MKPLRTFTQEDHQHFESNNPHTFEGHIRQIETQLKMMKLATGILEEHDLPKASDVKYLAKVEREYVRDLGILVDQLMKTLEESETTGMWLTDADVETAKIAEAKRQRKES